MHVETDEDDYIDERNPFKSYADDIVEDGASSASSAASDDGANAEDETYPPELAEIEWQISKGCKGHIHLACTHNTCGRTLRCPTQGRGLSQAYSSQLKWSPRCFAGLSKHAQAWWKDIPVEHEADSGEE